MLPRYFEHVFRVAAAMLLACSAHATALVGQPAPDFTLTDTAGKAVRLSDFKGKHVVLEWINPGCPFVRKHYVSGNMPALQKEAATGGVVWLSINSTSPDSGDYLKPEQHARWTVEQKATPAATLLDESGVVGKAYGARTTPHMYMVNPQGQLVYAGGIDSIPSSRAEDIKTAVNYVRQGMQEALSSKAISAPTSKPYGCSVKYKS